MCNVLQCFEMVWFPYCHFVEIGWIKAYLQLQVYKLVLSFHKNKAVDLGCCLMYMLQDSCFKYLVYFLFKALFKMNWYWVAKCLFGRNAWVKLYTLMWARKSAYSLKHFRIVSQYLFFVCCQLVYLCFFTIVVTGA